MTKIENSNKKPYVIGYCGLCREAIIGDEDYKKGEEEYSNYIFHTECKEELKKLRESIGRVK